jgi:hypothetical protein
MFEEMTQRKKEKRKREEAKSTKQKSLAATSEYRGCKLKEQNNSL